MTAYRYHFLLASERSGSNLLTRLVGSHSQVSGPSPSHLFRLFANNSWRYGSLEDQVNWELLVEDVIVNFEAKLGIWDVAANRESMLQMSPRDVATLLRHLYEKQASHDGADVILVKENQAAQFSEFLQNSFPSAHYVHLVRDPRDVAASWLKTEAMPGGVTEAVSTWLRDQEANECFLRRFKINALHQIRYEDLLANPQSTLSSVFDFLGVRHEPVHQSFFESLSIRRDAERIGAWKNLARPLMIDNTKSFEVLLTPEERAYVEYHCLDLMKKYRYLEGPGPEAPSSVSAPSPRKIGRSAASAAVSPQESEIRARRLAAIDRVLRRGPRNPRPGYES